MANESLNQLAQNMENLSSAYENSYSAGSNVNIKYIPDYIGYDAGLPNSTYSGGGNDIQLKGSFEDFARYNSSWSGYRRQRNLGPGGENEYCNQFVVARTSTMTIYALRNNTEIYKNFAPVGTINAANFMTVQGFQGDIISTTRPINIRSANMDPGVAYLGWMGYAFAHRQDRYTGTTLFIYAPNTTNVQLLYTTTDNYVTSLTSQATITISAGSYWTQSMLTTRNYYIYANKPVTCYAYNVSGTGMQDTLPLYPMDQDDKFGAFSTGGHILTTNNAGIVRAGSATSQVIYNRSSNGNSTTEVNQLSVASAVDTDTAPGQTSAGFFAGPVQKVQTGNNNLFTCESQGDGNGGEMTPFVSNKAFGQATILTSTADWATCIAESGTTVFRRNQFGNVLQSQIMSGTATYNLYFARFSALQAGDVLETADGTPMICYYDADSTLDDERVNFMSNSKMDLTLVTLDITTQNWGSDFEACAQGPVAPVQTAYIISSFSNGQQIFEDAACTIEWSTAFGPGWYFNQSTSERFYYQNYEAGGISDIQSCGKSERRLKYNIKFIGESLMGIPMYHFNYKNKKDGVGRFVGTMVDDLQRLGFEDALIYGNDAIYVNYSKIDVPFKLVE